MVEIVCLRFLLSFPINQQIEKNHGFTWRTSWGLLCQDWKQPTFQRCSKGWSVVSLGCMGRFLGVWICIEADSTLLKLRWCIPPVWVHDKIKFNLPKIVALLLRQRNIYGCGRESILQNVWQLDWKDTRVLLGGHTCPFTRTFAWICSLTIVWHIVAHYLASTKVTCQSVKCQSKQQCSDVSFRGVVCGSLGSFGCIFNKEPQSKSRSTLKWVFY